MDVFTSTTLEQIGASLRAIGYLEAIVGGLFAGAFGLAYIIARSGMYHAHSKLWPALQSMGPRIALGAIFFVMGGLNGLFQFVPQHPSSLREPCAACQPFLEGIVATGYLFPFIKGVELVAGAMLVLGLWIPLAAVILAPITLNIALYHVFLNPAGLAIAIVLSGLHLIVVWQQRRALAGLFVHTAAHAAARADAPRPDARAERREPSRGIAGSRAH